MKPRRTLRVARQRAGLSQRELSRRAGVPQSTVARIENGDIDPRFSTLQRLLRECGVRLEAENRLGQGVDASLIRQMLELTPKQRIQSATSAGREVDRIRTASRR